MMLSVSIASADKTAIEAIPAGLQSHLFIQMSQDASVDDGAAGPFPNTLTPAQIRGAYGVTGSGAGQTIAIIDAYDDPNAAADLATFDAAYGLPAPATFTKVDEYGNPVTATDPGDASRDGTDPAEDTVETSLDIEWAHVMTPAANILLVECDSLENTDLYTGIATAAAYPGVSVVSMSFGGPEYAGETGTDTIFTTPAGHQGVTFVASAGDTGAYAPDEDSPIIQPNYPATSDNVVAVGGTNLTVNPDDTYGSESGWGNGTDSYEAFDADGNPLGGGGGGISAYETEPAYQQFVTGNLGNGMRTEPDVALEGGPNQGVSVVDSYYTESTTEPWIPSQVYGTSLSAPLFAGIMADADARRVADGLSTLDGPTQTLPRIYEMPLNAFHDITMGNNGYQAGPGYDLVTGRGSPVGNVLINDLGNSFIGYHVFDDINADGVQQAGEPGAAGVTVVLEDTAGTTLQTTTTDADGFYQFLGVTAGTYTVHFDAPTGFSVSPLGTSASPILNSTANPATGNVTVVVAANGANPDNLGDDPYVNCGLVTETISITDASIQRPQAGLAPMTFTVTISPGSATNTYDVPYTTVDGTAADDTATTGPATVAGGDYEATSGTLVFAPGVVSETVTVEIVGNMSIEKNLIFTVQLSPPPGEFDLAESKTTGTGTIINTSFPSVSVATGVASETVTRSATADETIEFPVTLSAPAPFPVTVTYATSDQSAFGGADYVPVSGTLTFAVDPTTGLTASLTMDVPVTVNPGTTPSLNKTFLLTIAASATATLGTPSQAVGTIISNVPPNITAEPATVTESLTGTALLAFDIDVSPSLTSPFTLNYATADGTAVAGVDYGATSGTLTFATGQIQQTVYVPVYREFLSQVQKTLSFTISNPSVVIDLVSPTVTGTIEYLPTNLLAFRSGQKATYTDDLGQRVVLGMTGPGSGQIVFLGTDPSATNAYELSLTGTTAATNLSVSVSGTGQTTVNSIIDDGSLGTLSARSINVQSGTVSVSGTANAIDVGYLSESSISLGGTASSRPVSLAVYRAVDTSITSGQPIRSLTAGAYIDTAPATPDYITAPSVGTVHVTGNFGGTIRTTGAVAAIEVGGTLAGGVEAGGGIGSVMAGSLSGASLLAGVDGTSDSIATTTFSNAAASIGRVQVRSAFSDSEIAGASVGRVTFGSVSTAANGTPFGIVGEHIASVRTAVTGGAAVTVSNPKTKVSYGDFEVDLL